MNILHLSDIHFGRNNPEYKVKGKFQNKDIILEERVLDFIRQIGNPYCYISNGMVVKVSFSGKKSMEDCMKAAMFAED